MHCSTPFKLKIQTFLVITFFLGLVVLWGVPHFTLSLHAKKEKLVGYCCLSFKNSKTSESVAHKHNQYVSHDEVLISIKEKDLTNCKTTKKRKSSHGIASLVFENEPQNKISKMSNCNYQIGNFSVKDGNLSKQTGVEKASKSETNITETTESCQGVDVVLEKGEVNEEVSVEQVRQTAKEIQYCSQTVKSSIGNVNGSEGLVVKGYLNVKPLIFCAVFLRK